ncbi:LysR family transcriptional regulator [Mesorhizobium sp. dw_380]|uniref:LysR family transcriptional regulator n=1 Tax=Mesorhizobium sp. dw_380 TaxID=2812001 RepID=UPI001BDF4ED3|nr:LysR family transcriptional regulator [Mesorhizobium sp. dw_380]
MDIKGIDLNLLVSLDVLLEERNVTRAARRLHLSQPALSAQLNRLRHTFQDPLLIPADLGRGMTPTALALELVAPLHAALRDLEVVIKRRPNFDPMRDIRDFQVVTTDNGMVVVGLPLLRRLQSEAGPGVRLAFQLLDAAGVVGKIDRGEVDLLIAPPSMTPPALKTRHLYDEGYSMVQRKGHPRGNLPPSLDEYCSLDHILVSLDGGGFAGRVDGELAKMGRGRRIALSVPNFTLVALILRATNFVCTMPTQFVRTLGDGAEICELPLPVPPFAMRMAWHMRHDRDPAHLWLRHQVLVAAGYSDPKG